MSVWLIEYRGLSSDSEWCLDPDQSSCLDCKTDAEDLMYKLKYSPRFAGVNHRVVEYVRKEDLVKEQPKVTVKGEYTLLCRPKGSSMGVRWTMADSQPKEPTQASSALDKLLRSQALYPFYDFKLVMDVEIEDARVMEANELRAKAKELNEKADEIMKEIGK